VELAERPGARAARHGDDSYRIAIVEDHILQRRRTEELVCSQPGLEVVCSVDSLPDFLTWSHATTPALRPHLLILDLVVERGLSANPAVVAELVNAGILVLVLSAMASPSMVRAILRAGIGGIVGKRDSEADIIEAIWTVLGSEQWVTPELAAVLAADDTRPQLSDQEERALVLYASGLTLASVAQALGVGTDTAKTYLKRVKAKYAAMGRPVHSKLDLSQAATRDGFLARRDR
jgi:DNA-binding NarL/FixJ family response regulator